MASKYWLKLFHETIYDPKIMMRSPGARLRWYECLCLAGDIDKDGELPSIEHMIFVFRVSEEQLLDELSELIRAGLMVQEGNVYIVKNWNKRQAQMPDAERKYRDRDMKQKQEYYGGIVSESVAKSVRISDADIEVEVDKEVDKEVEVDDSSGVLTSFSKISGLPIPAIKTIRDTWLTELTTLKAKGVTDSVMKRACQELTDKGGYRITSPKSIVKACEVVLAEKKRKDDTGYIPVGSDSPFAGLVQR